MYDYDSRAKVPPYVLLPAVGIDWNTATLLGANWDEFIEVVSKGQLFTRKYVPSAFGVRDSTSL